MQRKSAACTRLGVLTSLLSPANAAGATEVEATTSGTASRLVGSAGTTALGGLLCNPFRQRSALFDSSTLLFPPRTRSSTGHDFGGNTGNTTIKRTDHDDDVSPLRRTGVIPSESTTPTTWKHLDPAMAYSLLEPQVRKMLALLIPAWLEETRRNQKLQFELNKKRAEFNGLKGQTDSIQSDFEALKKRLHAISGGSELVSPTLVKKLMSEMKERLLSLENKLNSLAPNGAEDDSLAASAPTTTHARPHHPTSPWERSPTGSISEAPKAGPAQQQLSPLPSPPASFGSWTNSSCSTPLRYSLLSVKPAAPRQEENRMSLPVNLKTVHPNVDAKTSGSNGSGSSLASIIETETPERRLSNSSSTSGDSLIDQLVNVKHAAASKLKGRRLSLPVNLEGVKLKMDSWQKPKTPDGKSSGAAPRQGENRMSLKTPGSKDSGDSLASITKIENLERRLSNSSSMSADSLDNQLVNVETAAAPRQEENRMSLPAKTPGSKDSGDSLASITKIESLERRLSNSSSMYADSLDNQLVNVKPAAASKLKGRRLSLPVDLEGVKLKMDSWQKPKTPDGKSSGDPSVKVKPAAAPTQEENRTSLPVNLKTVHPNVDAKTPGSNGSGGSLASITERRLSNSSSTSGDSLDNQLVNVKPAAASKLKGRRLSLPVDLEGVKLKMDLWQKPKTPDGKSSGGPSVKVKPAAAPTQEENRMSLPVNLKTVHPNVDAKTPGSNGSGGSLASITERRLSNSSSTSGDSLDNQLVNVKPAAASKLKGRRLSLPVDLQGVKLKMDSWQLRVAAKSGAKGQRTYFANDGLAESFPPPNEYFCKTFEDNKIPNDPTFQYVHRLRPHVDCSDVRKLLKNGPKSIRPGKCALLLRVWWKANPNCIRKDIPRPYDEKFECKGFSQKGSRTLPNRFSYNREALNARLRPIETTTPQNTVIEFWHPLLYRPAAGNAITTDDNGTRIYRRLPWDPSSVSKVKLLDEDRKDDDPSSSHTLQRMSVYFIPASKTAKKWPEEHSPGQMCPRTSSMVEGESKLH